MSINFFKKVLKNYSLPILFAIVFLLFPNHFVFADDGDTIARLLSWIVSLLISAVGVLLTLLIAVLEFVFGFQEFNVSGVSMGWAIARDIANTFFLIILLMIAFATILRLENYSMKRNLPKLIIMAVLINYSKFICLLLIELSQAIMMPFVVQFVGNGSSFVDTLHLAEFSTWRGAENVSDWTVFQALMLAFLFLIISFFVIIMMIGILMARIVAFWILMVLSPLAFLAYAVPGGTSYFSRWWSEFVKYLTVGPVLAFFTWLSFAVLEKASNVFAGENSFKEIGEKMNGIGTEISDFDNVSGFILAVALLIGAMKVTQGLGAVGGGFGMRMATNFKNKGAGWLKAKGSRATKLTGRRFGIAGLSAVSGISRALGGNKEGTSMHAVRNLANQWKTDIKDRTADEKKKKRLQTLKKMGMGSKSIEAVGAVADSKLGQNLKRGAGMVAAGAAIAANFAGVPSLSGGILTAGSIGYAAYQHRKKTKYDREQEYQKEFAEIKDDAKKKRDHARKHRDNLLQSDVATAKRDLDLKDALKEKQKTINDSEKELKKGNISKDEHAKNVKKANEVYDNKVQKIQDDYRNNASIKKINENYQKDIDKIQEEYTKKIEHLDARIPKNKRSKIHPNKVTMDAVKMETKKNEIATKRIEVLASRGSGVHEFGKSVYYSPDGQKEGQKEFFRQLNSGTEKSNKALKAIEKTLSDIRAGSLKLSKPQKENLQSFKEGIAAYKKGGGDVSKMSTVINLVNEISTGDGTDKKHTATVEDMEEHVIEKA